ncbi:hypothetical protein E7T09_21560 [Deinococcus sp. KSM4-11]|uniref:hypothetical protein n=1 Tax=Deinococcus sp. KSM4-11 TaxID=2568654 RepID=UPI0010A4132F|nr:hypothetical protein [Deinococcus sp. KSM4-11]THF83613.1 hypothetical protein E7T09_21560 [Deinococcus sp. KSM4-11]
MSDSNQPEEFRAQVERLVAEGKLTPEEAQGLLEGLDGGRSDQGGERSALQYREIPDGTDVSDVPPDLILDVSGYTLQVVTDSHLSQPQLHANEDGRLVLEATPQGWRVARQRGQQHVGWNGVKAILSVPFAPRHVKAEVNGGNLTLPDLGGEMIADVNGGNVRMGRAASLKADVNGGNLNAAEMGGPTNLNVNGGNLSLSGAHALNASVNGGNLKWAGVLNGGDHRVEVNAGNATLHLMDGSSLRVEADVTVGAFKADFPTQKTGSFITTRHTGQLGGGEASLSCKVAAGQIKLVSA